MSTFLHGYELTGVKESVADFISNISPTETPFASMTRKVSEHNTLFQWLTDTDATAAVETAVAQGADAVVKNMVEPKVLNSYTQIFTRAAKVDGTAEAMGLYGRGKPMAYQMMKAGREIKRGIEVTMLAAQDGVPAASGTAGKLDGFLTRRAAGGAIPSENIVEAATAKTFLESELQTALLTLWKKGAKPSVIMFPAEYAAQLSALRDTNSSENMFDGETSVTINRKVDVYVDPLGQRLKLIPNRYMPADTIYIFSPEMFEQHVLRNFNTKDLPANGDYVAKQLIVELGLANKNPDASAVYNLTGTAVPAPKRK